MLTSRFARTGRWLAFVSLAVLALLGFSPVGNAFMLPLENRFPSWVLSHGVPDGIIVLGGAIDASRPGRADGAQRGGRTVGGRARAGAALPQCPHPVFRRQRALMDGGSAEAEVRGQLLDSFGIARGRITLEDRSRNTAENAAFSKTVVQPKPGERWLLVTSAYHMPRAIGVFPQGRISGRTLSGRLAHTWRRGCAVAVCDHERRAAADRCCLHEWIGLLVYWLTGRTSELFPGPTRGDRRKELQLSMTASSFPATDGFPHFSCYWQAHVSCLGPSESQYSLFSRRGADKG